MTEEKRFDKITVCPIRQTDNKRMTHPITDKVTLGSTDVDGNKDRLPPLSLFQEDT